MIQFFMISANTSIIGTYSNIVAVGCVWVCELSSINSFCGSDSIWWIRKESSPRFGYFKNNNYLKQGS